MATRITVIVDYFKSNRQGKNAGVSLLFTTSPFNIMVHFFREVKSSSYILNLSLFSYLYVNLVRIKWTYATNSAIFSRGQIFRSPGHHIRSINFRISSGIW